MTTFADLQPGRVFYLGPDAGIQWRIRPILLRIIRVWEANWDDNAYLDGYEIDRTTGDAIARRTCLVTAVSGLRIVAARPDPRARNGKPVNASPSIPRQRTNTRTTARSPR